MSKKAKRRTSGGPTGRPLYSPLDTKAQEIRLMTIMPLRAMEMDDTPARCSMHVCRISEARQSHYTALSYCWGDFNDTVEVEINGQALKITRNLSDLLRELRASYRGFKATSKSSKSSLPPIWADAICIDQCNLRERSHQVALMKAIYSSADQVVVWLGYPQEDPGKYLLRTNAWKPRSSPYAGLSGEWKGGCGDRHSDACDKTIDTIPSPDVAKLLRMLLDSGWWSRMWTIQEVALCSNVAAFWGQHRFHFQDLQRWLHHVVVRLLLLQDSGFVTDIDTDGSYSLLTSEYLFRKRKALEIARVGFHERLTKLSAREILTCLSAVSERECLEPRDRIYGIMSLFPNNLNLKPNYARSLSDVFQDGTLGLMQFMGSPAPLMMAGLQTRYDPDLASWVPDYRLMQDLPTLSGQADGQRHSIASPAHTYRRANRLMVSALLIDEVNWASPCFPRTSEAELEDPTTAQMIKRVLAEYLSQQTSMDSKPDGDERTEAFLCAIMAGRRGIWWDPSRSLNWGDRPKADQSLVIDVVLHWLLKKDMNQSTLPYGLAACLSEQCLFSTRAGRVGKTPLIAPEKGDVVAIIAKVPLPVIIRPVQDQGQGVYRLIRTCLYCHGVMRGEAVRRAGREGNRDDTLPESVGELSACPSHVESMSTEICMSNLVCIRNDAKFRHVSQATYVSPLSHVNPRLHVGVSTHGYRVALQHGLIQ